MENTIETNYHQYLEEPLKIGFTEKFPQHSILDTITISTKVRGFSTTFNVHYGLVSFGGNNTCNAIFTERVEIGSKLPLGGWGSHCYADEAKAMEEAVIEMCKKHDQMICNKVCSWPIAKAIVQKNFYN